VARESAKRSRKPGGEEMEDHDLESLKQAQVYPPPADISSRAHVKSIDEYNKLYEKSVTDPDAFWAEIAERDFYWQQKWNKVRFRLMVAFYHQNVLRCLARIFQCQLARKITRVRGVCKNVCPGRGAIYDFALCR
jgi:hypothetical protein